MSSNLSYMYFIVFFKQSIVYYMYDNHCLSFSTDPVLPATKQWKGVEMPAGHVERGRRPSIRSLSFSRPPPTGTKKHTDKTETVLTLH